MFEVKKAEACVSVHLVGRYRFSHIYFYLHWYNNQIQIHLQAKAFGGPFGGIRHVGIRIYQEVIFICFSSQILCRIVEFIRD